MSVGMLKEFALKIVKPYFGGNMNKAIRSLMEKAIEEETTVNNAIILKKVNSYRTEFEHLLSSRHKRV